MGLSIGMYWVDKDYISYYVNDSTDEIEETLYENEGIWEWNPRRTCRCLSRFVSRAGAKAAVEQQQRILNENSKSSN